MEEFVVIGTIPKWRTNLKKAIEKKGGRVLCFLDSYKKGDIEGVPIIPLKKAKEFLGNFKGTFLFTFPCKVHYLSAFLELKKQFGEDIRWKDYRETYKLFKEALILTKEEGDWWLGKDYDKEKALQVLSYLSDEKSRKIYKNWIYFRETLDVSFVEEPEEDQYFPKDLSNRFLKDRIQNILDIGAYNGDTVDKFLNIFKNLKFYIAFEPDKENYIELLGRCQDFAKLENLKFLLLPLAAYNRLCVLNLKSQRYMSKIAEKGKPILGVRCDDLFHNFEIDLIKVDVEGAEMRVLEGLEKIISKYSPIILVSIYHKPADFHDIPLFLKKLNPNYDFYIRVHSSFFMESVLYAFPKINLKEALNGRAK